MRGMHILRDIASGRGRVMAQCELEVWMQAVRLDEEWAAKYGRTIEPLHEQWYVIEIMSPGGHDFNVGERTVGFVRDLYPKRPVMYLTDGGDFADLSTVRIIRHIKLED